jgi:hypothetical protein
MLTPHFAVCPLAQGDYELADTTRGIELDTNKLGHVYYDVGNISSTTGYRTNKPRWIRLVKNTSGGTLTRNLAVTFGITAGDFRKNIDALGDANDKIAGFVEDGYTAGVPANAIFRIVIEGVHYAKYHGSTDTQVATVPGEPLVCAGSGKVFGQDVAVAAGAATFGQTNGVCGFAEEVTVNDATAWDIHKLIYVYSLYK